MAAEPEAHVDSARILLQHLSKNVTMLRGVRIRWHLNDISYLMNSISQLMQAAAAQGVLKPEELQASQHRPTIKAELWNSEHRDVVCAAFNGLCVADCAVRVAEHGNDYFSLADTLTQLVPGIFEPSEYPDNNVAGVMQVVVRLSRAVQALETFEPPKEAAERYVRDIAGAQIIATMIRNDMDFNLAHEMRGLTED